MTGKANGKANYKGNNGSILGQGQQSNLESSCHHDVPLRSAMTGNHSPHCPGRREVLLGGPPRMPHDAAEYFKNLTVSTMAWQAAKLYQRRISMDRLVQKQLR